MRITFIAATLAACLLAAPALGISSAGNTQPEDPSDISAPGKPDCSQVQVSAAGNAFASDSMFPFYLVEYLDAGGNLHTVAKGNLLPIDFAEARFWFTKQFLEQHMASGAVKYFNVDAAGVWSQVCPNT